MKSHIIKKE